MKVRIAIFGLMIGVAVTALSRTAFGQVSNPSIIPVAAAPSGSCSEGLPNQQVISTGAQYSCQSGTWGPLGAGSGGVITASPQSSLCYFDLAGTQAHCKGDSGITTDGSGNLKAVSLNAPSISNVVYASQFSGADAGVKIAAAMAAVSNNGTVVADFSGSQTMSVDPFSGVTKSVTVQFTGCATFTVTTGIALGSGSGYSQELKGAGRNCTIFQDGAGSITLLAEGGGTKASDLSLNYNGHSSVIALTQASNSTAERIIINGGFPTYGVLRSGGPGTGIYSAHTVDVTVNGTGTAPQYGLAEISSPVGYVGLNLDDNFQANNTSVAAYYLDGGDSGGPTTCHNCDLGGNAGVGLWIEYAIANIQGDCEGNTLGNVYVNPANLLNAAATVHCQSAQDVFNTVTGITGTISNSSSSLTVTDATGISPGTTINVAGATFSDTSSTYERVTGVSGTTVTLAHPTTSSGGATGATIFSPVTPQYLQNGPGYPSTYSTELFTEQQKFLESPYIRRAWLEGPESLRPDLNAPTESIWRLCGGSAGNACTSANTDFDITDNAVNIIADFNAPNHEIYAGAGGFGIIGCCTVIDGGGDVNAHGYIAVQGTQIIPSNATFHYIGGKIFAGSGTPTDICSSTVNTFAIETNGSLVSYMCSGATGSYAWNALGANVPSLTINGDSAITAGPRAFIQADTGNLTSIVASGQYDPVKVVKAGTVENIVATASAFTCTGNPTITLEDCGTAAGACASPTALGSATVTAANTSVDGTITSATITAGHYLVWETTAGTCTALNISASAEYRMN